MAISLFVRSDLAEKIRQTCNFQTAITKNAHLPMSTQDNTLYLSNVNRNPTASRVHTDTPLALDHNYITQVWEMSNVHKMWYRATNFQLPM